MEDKTFIINEKEIEWSEMEHGKKIHHFRKDFTKLLTTNKLVASLYEVPPGRVSWPFHYHMGNEEAFYILEGEGELRTHDSIKSIKRGDFIRFPIGEGGVHQLKNTSKDNVLRYLDFGTTNHPDLVFMPDSEKVGIFGGGAPCQNTKIRKVWKYFRLGTEINYMENE